MKKTFLLTLIALFVFNALSFNVLAEVVVDPLEAEYTAPVGYEIAQAQFFDSSQKEIAKVKTGDITGRVIITCNYESSDPYARLNTVLYVAHYEGEKLIDIASSSKTSLFNMTTSLEAKINILSVTEQTKVKMYLWCLDGMQPMMKNIKTIGYESSAADVLSFSVDGGIDETTFVVPARERVYSYNFSEAKNEVHKNRLVFFYRNTSMIYANGTAVPRTFTFELSEGATIAPKDAFSGTLNPDGTITTADLYNINADNQVIYTVTAEDGTQKDYYVKCVNRQGLYSPAMTYLNEDFETLDLGSFASSAADESMSLTTNTVGSYTYYSTFSANEVFGNETLTAAIETYPDGSGANKGLKLDFNTSGASVRLPAAGQNYGVAANAKRYGVVRLKGIYERQANFETSRDFSYYIQVSNFAKIYFIDNGLITKTVGDETVPMVQLYAQQGTGTLYGAGAPLVQTVAYIGSVAVGEEFELTVLAKVGQGTSSITTADYAHTELYYYLNGNMINSSCTAGCANNSKISYMLITGLNPYSSLFIDEFELWGGDARGTI